MKDCPNRGEQQFGNYRLGECLGGGGFACVYKGRHIYLETYAAIKLLHGHLTEQMKDAFLKEARTIARLKHTHIVQVLEFGIEAGIPFLVMSYLPDGSLRNKHPKGSILPLPTVLSYVKQIANALKYAHDEGIVHRDIKPDNVLLEEQSKVLLGDFGIATVTGSLHQSLQEMAGTVTYMAPEQIQGKPRRASDQYSLGIVVYEWLTGSVPFQGTYVEIVNQHLLVPPPPLRERNSAIPLAVEEVVLKALNKEPEQRFESVLDFAAALEQAAQPKPSVTVSSLADLTAGVSLEQALTVLRIDSGKPDRKWVSRGFLENLRPLLSDPITFEQAEALKGYGFKRISEQDFLSWLASQHQSLSQFLREAEQRCQEAVQRREEERQREDQERSILFREFTSIPCMPLQKATGGDVLEAFYDVWARCAIPPGVHLPGGGMGDMVLDNIRDEFTTHFIVGLQAVLPGNRDVQTISNREQLSTAFDRIWDNLQPDQRRPTAMRIWGQYLLPKASKHAGVEPGDAEGLLNLKEFMRLRHIPPHEKWRYEWLPGEYKGQLRSAAKAGKLRLQLEYESEKTGVLSSAEMNPKTVARGKRLVLKYHVHNDLDFEVPVWLGASLVVDGQYYFNTHEDADAILQRGEHTYTRFLTIAKEWQQRSYRLQVELWYGIRSLTECSTAIATCWNNAP